MADARALLRARREETRITHPHARYTSAGQLRCAACGAPVKSAAMWEGHIGSKAHRVAAAALRAREEEARRREEGERLGKRKAGDEWTWMRDVDSHAKKRRLSEEPHPPAMESAAGGFPADFFSDPAQAPTLSAGADGEGDEGEDNAEPDETEKTQLEREWAQFQASLAAAAEARDDDRRETFERATVFAEPEIVGGGTEGFPPAVAGAPEPAEAEETEEERRRRKETEDRELIMDRLVEEERVQEEADERVGLLKARVEALKKAREAKRAGRKT
ncbi:hypothetical protein DFH11DRAFT_1686917 [Phellopilus nigrolimitatus]|nr:hypothetical protein DFH11DRAFT_1686917 [Phellopilus nigrolimitatus]